MFNSWCEWSITLFKDVRAKNFYVDFFFVKLLLQLGNELLVSGMQKYGVHQLRFGDKISEREPNLEKSVFLTR